MKKKKVDKLPVYEIIIEEGTGVREIILDEKGTESAMTKELTYDFENKTVKGMLIEANKKVYRNDDGGEYYVVFTPETINKLSDKLPDEVFINDNTKGMIIDKWIKNSGLGKIPDGSLFIEVKIVNDEFWVGDYNSYSMWFAGLFGQKNNIDLRNNQ